MTKWAASVPPPAQLKRPRKTSEARRVAAWARTMRRQAIPRHEKRPISRRLEITAGLPGLGNVATA
eukprot:830763-Lingulodinium_polyedra.AAC.1